jgi:hypothetical protein
MNPIVLRKRRVGPLVADHVLDSKVVGSSTRNNTGTIKASCIIYIIVAMGATGWQQFGYICSVGPVFLENAL